MSELTCALDWVAKKPTPVLVDAINNPQNLLKTSAYRFHPIESKTWHGTCNPYKEAAACATSWTMSILRRIQRLGATQAAAFDKNI
ncbi:MAG: hypothetical protein ACPG6R_02445 [Aequoribacter sp.]|uniref:hypothetical protein n=1 Tax=Aequoribacter sp. TaxID=2847771 RepID=UPI003C49DC51